MEPRNNKLWLYIEFEMMIGYCDCDCDCAHLQIRSNQWMKKNRNNTLISDLLLMNEFIK